MEAIQPASFSHLLKLYYQSLCGLFVDLRYFCKPQHIPGAALSYPYLHALPRPSGWCGPSILSTCSVSVGYSLHRPVLNHRVQFLGYSSFSGPLYFPPSHAPWSSLVRYFTVFAIAIWLFRSWASCYCLFLDSPAILSTISSLCFWNQLISSLFSIFNMNCCPDIEESTKKYFQYLYYTLDILRKKPILPLVLFHVSKP